MIISHVHLPRPEHNALEANGSRPDASNRYRKEHGRTSVCSSLRMSGAAQWMWWAERRIQSAERGFLSFSLFAYVQPVKFFLRRRAVTPEEEKRSARQATRMFTASLTPCCDETRLLLRQSIPVRLLLLRRIVLYFGMALGPRMCGFL